MRKINYFNNLIHYLSEFKDFLIESEKQLKLIKEYYELTYNSNSATDSTELIRISNLLDKISYFAKYLDVSKDFYEELNA